jgi:hypothetical protein
LSPFNLGSSSEQDTTIAELKTIKKNKNFDFIDNRVY